MNVLVSSILFLIALSFHQKTYASSDTCELLLDNYVGTPLVGLTEDRYAALRAEIVKAYQDELKQKTQDDEQTGTTYHENHYPHIRVNRSSKFEIEYDRKRREDDASDLAGPTPSYGRILIDEFGVLRISTASQDFLNFLAEAIFRDDLVSLLREIRAYKVELFILNPELSLKPIDLILIPIVPRRPQATIDRSTPPKFTAIEIHAPGGSTVVRGENPGRVFQFISQYVRPEFTALSFLNEKLGFSFEEVTRNPYAPELALEILRGLGYEYSPALQEVGYWQARQPGKETPVYRKAVAALLKMKELDLVYVSREFTPPQGVENFNVGIISKAEYDRTWAQHNTFAHPGKKKKVDGVEINEGLAKAIEHVENQGYRFVPGQGYRLDKEALE